MKKSCFFHVKLVEDHNYYTTYVGDMTTFKVYLTGAFTYNKNCYKNRAVKLTFLEMFNPKMLNSFACLQLLKLLCNIYSTGASVSSPKPQPCFLWGYSDSYVPTQRALLQF